MKAKCLICNCENGHAESCPMRPGIPVFGDLRESIIDDYCRAVEDRVERTLYDLYAGDSKSQVLTELNISRRYEPEAVLSPHVYVPREEVWAYLEAAAKRNASR